MVRVLGFLALLVMTLGVWFGVRRVWQPSGTTRLRRLTLAVRLIILGSLLLALTPLTWTRTPERQALVVVADRSGSAGSGQQTVLDGVATLDKNKPSGDTMSVVAFSDRAVVEAAPSEQLNFNGFTQTLSLDNTNIAAALTTGGAVADGADMRRHVVLISDGRETVGDAQAAAAVLRGQGVRVDVVPLDITAGPDARIDSVIAPYVIAPNTRAHVLVHLAANTTTTVVMTTFVDGSQVLSRPVSLTSSGAGVELTLDPLAAGAHSVTVKISGGADALPQNDSGGAIINVIDTPQVLVVEGANGAGAAIAGSLRAAGVVVDIVPKLPSAGLTEYQSVVLCDVPQSALAGAAVAALDDAVKTHGVGLVVSGGANSFGAGGYQGKPIEKLLPVEMQVPERPSTAPIGVVLVLESVENPNADATIRQAAHAIVNELGPNDYIGIAVNGYGPGASWPVPFQAATNKAAINSAIDATTDYNDPPSYGPAMQDAQATLNQHPNLRKQVIVLGDGDAEGPDPAVVAGMVHDGITVSSVGADIDHSQGQMAVMQQIATEGGGKFYQTTNLSQVPEFLIKVTTENVRPWIIDGSVQLRQVGAGAALSGIDVSAMPNITGYVAAQPREASEVLLNSPEDDPVMAEWHYGNGTVLTWMSDAAGKWSGDLLRWSNGGRLFANMVASTLSVSPDSNMALSAQAAGDHGHLVAVVRGSASGTQVIATVQSDGSEPIQNIVMTRTGSAQFEADFPFGSGTRYTIRANGQGPSYQGGAITGLVVSYAPEYRYWGADSGRLQLIAAAGGGAVFPPATLATVWSQPVPEVPRHTPLWPYLLATAAILFPVDVGLRLFGLTARGGVARRTAAHPAKRQPAGGRRRG